MIELVVKKAGEEWCLFTSDGSRKLGCHPTEKEAHAQEAAIKAGAELLAAGGPIALESTAYFDELKIAEIPIDNEVTVLDNGDVLKWMPLALAGEGWLNGPHQFDITEGQIKQAIKNFESGGRQPLPITIGHVNDAGAPAVGWIEDISLRDGGPWGHVRWLAKTWSRIVEGEYRFFSLEFFLEDQDRHGKKIGFNIDGGALLNKPFFPIRVDQAADHGGAPCYRLSRLRLAAPRRAQEEHMAYSVKQVGEEFCVFNGDEKMGCYPTEDAAKGHAAKMAESRPAPDPIIAGDRVTLTREQYNALHNSQREVERLRGENATMRSDKEATETRLSRLERSRTADRIRNAVEKLQSKGVIVQLGDFVLEHDAHCFEWLTGAPWGCTSVEGLEKLAKDDESNAHLPRVKLGGEKSGGTDRLPPADLDSESGRKEAVRRHVMRLKREYDKEELATVLRRRGTDLETFAREDLAAEHPEYADRIMAETPKAS